MQQRIEAALIEWPTDGGGPRLLGVSMSRAIVTRLRDEIVAARTRELARLGHPLCAGPSGCDDGPAKAGHP